MQARIRGDGDPIVLVPGGLTGAASWEPLVELLARSARVVHAQLLNVQLGLEGEPLPPDYGVRTEVEALVETLEDAGITRPVDVAAWSYGALVALELALDHPGRVRTLALVEPLALFALGAADAEARSFAEFLRRFRPDADVSEADLEGFLCGVGWLLPGKSPRDLRAMPQWPAWMRHRQSLRNSAAMADFADDVGRLQRLRLPVSVVEGTASAPLLHRIAGALAMHIRNAQRLELPDGPGPHLTSPERFLDALARLRARATTPEPAETRIPTHW